MTPSMSSARPIRATIARLFAVLWACIGFADTPADEESYAAERARMVDQQMAARDIRDKRVLNAMRTVPRHQFVPEPLRTQAYDDSPLPIGHDQTISQPYIVALMTQLARPAAGDRALEVGTGSGYQAAVLSQLVSHVYTIELIEPLARDAGRRLKDLGYKNITVRADDGYAGWPEMAPFDVILVTAAPEEVPDALIDQLKPGGRLVVPVGPAYSVQELRVLEKTASGNVRTERIAPVMFVPMQKGEKKPR